jgi:hypothetical protein
MQRMSVNVLRFGIIASLNLPRLPIVSVTQSLYPESLPYIPITLYWQRGRRHAVANYARLTTAQTKRGPMSCDKLSTSYVW